jgi:rhodanese-related sulfurtransferase
MTRTIDPNTTMADLLEEYPGAQRALFRTYHIGGCASCGFSPSETLASVCQRNENLPVDEVIETILAGHEADQKMQIAPEEVVECLKSGNETRLIDVRSREEWDAVHIEGSTFFTQELMNEMMSEWPKDRKIIFVCHHGFRSLDAAAFFAGHGFENVRSMTGGIDSWSLRVDMSLPRYHVE